MVCPKIFMQYIPANVKSTKNICNFLRDVFHIRKIFVTVCTYDLRHKWFQSMKWKQKTAKLDTSFSSFVKIIKRAISKLEIYSALKLPFCCSYFFYLWIFNSKKSIINRKLLWLNYLISSSIVLLPVNAKVELPTRSCRMCTFIWI